jgi:GT2 family glycosyltransferase
MEPSREALVAQIKALRRVVEGQRSLIDSMRASRFWQLRDEIFALRARLTGKRDPLPADAGVEPIAAFGDAYQLLRLINRRSDRDAALLRSLVRHSTIHVPFDVIVDARSSGLAGLDASVGSLVDQLYPHWRARVWFAAAGSDERAWLKAAHEGDGRVAAAPWDGTNLDPAFALGVVGGGDRLEPDALLFIAAELVDGADLVYSDEDRMLADGTYDEPTFKPDWSPESEWSRDYMGALCAVRGSLLAEAGGIDADAGTACWYAAVLRASASCDRIAHVPRVLYHRRNDATPVLAADVAPVLARELLRRGEFAEVHQDAAHATTYFLARADERVAVVVPTRDRPELLERCLASVFAQTDHRSFEVLVVDNGSVEPATREPLERWSCAEPERFRVLQDGGAFNFSRLNNRAVAETDAPYIMLLNNDTEVIEPAWMSAMLGQARRSAIGAVGALLLYEDATVQHAGIVLGGVLGGTAHAYRHVRADGPDAPNALRFDTNYLAVTGACLMVAREKFDRVGGLDESLAVAYNDVDFCLKLYQAGYRNVVVPRARLYHHESRSRGDDDTREKQARAAAERTLLWERWPQWLAHDPYYNPNLTRAGEDFSIRL